MIAQKPPANLEQVDSQLAGFNQQLARSASVLDELASIQLQFEDLAETYADFKQHVQRLKADGSGLGDLRSDMEQRFQALDDRLGRAQQEFVATQGGAEDPREAMQIHIESMESRLRTELRGALSRIDQAGFSPMQIEKVEKLDVQVRGLRNALRTAERRERMLQNWLVAVTIMALMALGMPLLMPLILGEESQANAPNPENPAISTLPGAAPSGQIRLPPSSQTRSPQKS